MRGVWKQDHGPGAKAPPDDSGGKQIWRTSRLLRHTPTLPPILFRLGGAIRLRHCALRYRLLRQLPRFDGVDLQRDVAAVDAALRKRAAGEPQARLSGAGPHVAKLLGFFVEAPNRADTAGVGFAEARGDDVVEALVAGGQDDQIGAQRRTVAKLQSLGRKALDVGCLNETDFSNRDQFGTSDVEIIAAAAGAEF